MAKKKDLFTGPSHGPASAPSAAQKPRGGKLCVTVQFHRVALSCVGSLSVQARSQSFLGLRVCLTHM